MASDDDETELCNLTAASKAPTPTPSVTFNGPSQLHTLLFWQTLRWLGTIVFVVFLFATIKIFQNKGNIGPVQKNLFNCLNIALSLVLGYNFNECFKESARILRWKLRAWAKKGRQRDKIMEIESIQTIFYLGLEILVRRPKEVSRKLLMVLFSIIWILLFLAAGSSIALLNLAYSTQDGVNWNGTYPRNGTVNATDLRCYFPHRHQGSDCPPDVVPRQATANLYGEMGLDSNCGAYTDISEVQNSREYDNYYCRRTPGSQEFAFRFYEYNPDDQQRTYPFFTNRTVTASAGECIIYPNVTQSPGIDLDGDPAATNYTFTNGSFTDSISIPKANDGLSGTTYIYRGKKTPEDADSPSVVCGPRCLWMWVHKAQGPKDKSTFYKCPITVSNVSNAPYDYQKINDVIARTAAASIALHGGWTGTFKHRIFTSFNFFAAGTDWDAHDAEDPSMIGAHIAEFSIASLSTMASKNPSVQVPSDHVPHLGTSLQIKWQSTIGLFVFIVGLHAVVAFAAVWAVKDIVVRDG